MSKIDLNNVAGGFNLSKINDNFQKIEDALNNGALWRDNPDGEPNQMKNDLDMNGNRIYNLPAPVAENEPARYKEIQDVQGAIDQAHLDAQRAKDEADRAKYEADRAAAAAESSDDSNLKVFSTKADADFVAATLPDGQVMEIEIDETRNGCRTRYIVQSGALVFLSYEFGPKQSRSLSLFGAMLDGTTDCTEAMLVAIDAGVTPIIDGPCYMAPATVAQASRLLASCPSWQVLSKTTLVLPQSEPIPMEKVMSVSNTTLLNLTIQGRHTNSGAPTNLQVLGGTPGNYTMSVDVPVTGPVKIGDYIMLQPNKTNTTDMGDFIAGTWRILSVAGSTITFLCGNADDLPSNDGTGPMLSYIMHTIVRFARGQVGVRVNGGAIGGLVNLVIGGGYDFTAEPPVDGAADGLQVGGAPDTPNTGLNASEQIMGGYCWVSRVAVVDFQGNGTQVLGGRLVGVLMHTSGNAWRGQQSAGSGYIQVKSSVTSGNGASGYETEEVGSMNCHDSWSVGNKQQGVYAIGTSQVSALGIRCRFNKGNALDARNGANILADSAKITASTGTQAIYSNGGRILVGENAEVSGNITLDECGIIVAKGATSVTGTVSWEEGCVYQQIDGTIYKPATNINQIVYNTSYKFRMAMSSIGDVTMSTAPIGSSTWTDHITFRADGTMRPSTSTRNWGSQANPWNTIYSRNVTLTPPASVTPLVNGEMMFELTSNTQLKVKVKGSDGVVRSASLTLA